MSKNNKKMVEAITSMDVDFAQWYTDIVKKAELVDYATVKGCMIIRPYGYALWENIQKDLDGRFKATGHENVYMPMFIPESLLQKEKDHIEGFAPEVAWVTQFGEDKLTERICVRPTSETLFCEHYSKIVQSYNDLPKLYNQWCSVVRCEKTTRPFLRTTEFLWQEGHTVHATAEEAQEETLRMLNIYAKHCEEILAIPVIKGQKTEKEKFAGAKATYTIESLMHDGKALQTGTSHNFGDNFAKAFNIQYTDNTGKLQYVHETSWGMTTRLIGALIMVHGDDNGLVLPPRVAPIQLVIVPVAQHKEGVLYKAKEIKDRLSSFARVKLDDSNKMPGWKFAEYEMKGVPLRLEIGPKDMENNQCVIARRDTMEKVVVSLDDIEKMVPELLDAIHDNMLEKARTNRDTHTTYAKDYDEFKDAIENKPGFIKAMWCGDKACEDKIKEETAATSRCIPFDQEHISDKCVCCGKEAKHMVYWGRAY
ncbi:proline--tRNA ligase [Clostridium sp. 19966]|uniref:proline--tRNA ligase n=1 Tax=Clostridium sp. 19966 TaxID=2768166 RepID=UPI0028E00148|nr:proline--tRNA ligase [Clostridium sp. 19966]MDT8715793.1 proline--tRNA ligase [Clostridium sp. 19966]